MVTLHFRNISSEEINEHLSWQALPSTSANRCDEALGYATEQNLARTLGLKNREDVKLCVDKDDYDKSNRWLKRDSLMELEVSGEGWDALVTSGTIDQNKIYSCDEIYLLLNTVKTSQNSNRFGADSTSYLFYRSDGELKCEVEPIYFHSVESQTISIAAGVVNVYNMNPAAEVIEQVDDLNDPNIARLNWYSDPAETYCSTGTIAVAPLAHDETLAILLQEFNEQQTDETLVAALE